MRKGRLENFSTEVDDLPPCGDLITMDQFVDVELTLEWRLQLGGNSGIKYLVREDRPNSWEKISLEYYLNTLKDEHLPDHEAKARVSKIKWHHRAIGFELQLNQQQGTNFIADIGSTGALYDLIAPVRAANALAGQFNQAGVVVRGDRVEHWINVKKVVESSRSSKRLLARIERSKFNPMRGFGQNKRGHIVLQDALFLILFVSKSVFVWGIFLNRRLIPQELHDNSSIKNRDHSLVQIPKVKKLAKKQSQSEATANLFMTTLPLWFFQVEGLRVHTITQPCWLWTIFKDMSQMRLTTIADYFCSLYSVTHI